MERNGILLRIGNKIAEHKGGSAMKKRPLHEILEQAVWEVREEKFWRKRGKRLRIGTQTLMSK